MATTLPTPIERVASSAEWKRAWFDRGLAAWGLVLASPLLAAAAVAVWIDDGRPVLFKQTRVGQGGRPFTLLKFRSMRQSKTGALITASGDSRITKTGRILRKFKLDELPQLWNVVRGEMSLVGPRPEVPRYVDMGSEIWRNVLSAKPGITCVASLLYRDEEKILSGFQDPDVGYRETVLPDKLALNVAYLQGRSLLRDIKLLALTLRYSFLPGAVDAVQVRRFLA